MFIYESSNSGGTKVFQSPFRMQSNIKGSIYSDSKHTPEMLLVRLLSLLWKFLIVELTDY